MPTFFNKILGRDSNRVGESSTYNNTDFASNPPSETKTSDVVDHAGEAQGML